MTIHAFITGSGVELPANVITNEDLAEQLNIAPAQIFKSTGIRSRHWADEHTCTSQLAVRALRMALTNARLKVADVDYLIVGTMTPDRFVPGTASAIQKCAGLREIPALDIRTACCNALYALQLATALIKSGAARNVAICLAEIQSRYLDLSAESAHVSMLFGDGAAALIVSEEPNDGALEVMDVLLATDGSYVDDLGVRSPGTAFPEECRANYFPRMNGQSVILQASRRMVAASRALLDRNQLCADDLRWIVPHQANANLLHQVTRGIAAGNAEVVSVIENCGNTSSASMGIALDSLRSSERVKPGDWLLLPAFAAGFTWGAGLCRAA
jgi:3-oxoacyl-[acyl-carrier-protein] synthase-3